MTTSELNEKEKARYERQIRLAEVGFEGQMKLKTSSVLVIGAGALGCPVLQYLTAAGIGTIGIVDNDWIDESNLHRQVLYNTSDIDIPKPKAALEKLHNLNPFVQIIPYFNKFDKTNALEIATNYDILIDCTDNFAARYLINDVAVILNKPVVYGAVERFSGQVIVLNYKNGATLRCIYPNPPHPLEAPSCDEIGVLGSIAGIIGSMQANEALKIILEFDGVLSGKMFFIDSLNFSTHIISFERNPALADIKTLGDYKEICLSGNNQLNEINEGALWELKSKFPELMVIDLRSDHSKSSIGFNSISIPYYEFVQKMDLLPDNCPLVFYCDNGIKSAAVINYLQNELNMSNLYYLNLNSTHTP